MKSANVERARGKRSASAQPSSLLLIRNAAFGALVAALCSLLLLLLGAALCLLSSHPLALIRPIGLCSLFLSALVGGFVSVRRHGRSALLCGLLCGALLLLFYKGISLFADPSEALFSFSVSLILSLLVPVFSIFGAFLGNHRSQKVRRRRR